MSVNEKMSAIADAIRDKTNGSAKLSLDAMATEIPKVYDAGKQAEYDAFWDVYQKNGTRTHYIFGFAGHGWTNENYKPKYLIKPDEMYEIYAGTGIQRLETDMLDTSEVTLFSSAFSGSTAGIYIEYIGSLNMKSATKCTTMFNNNWRLITIEELILPDNPSQITDYTSMFRNCTKLAEIRIGGGVIGFNIDMRWSTKLSHDSLMSIINALYDYSADTSGTTHTITIGSDNIAKLTNEELETVRSKGWEYQ